MNTTYNLIFSTVLVLLGCSSNSGDDPIPDDNDDVVVKKELSAEFTISDLKSQ